MGVSSQQGAQQLMKARPSKMEQLCAHWECNCKLWVVQLFTTATAIASAAAGGVEL
jgi:hypothetical protein